MRLPTYPTRLVVKMEAKPKRGFATMDPEKRREICSAGGRAAHAKGTAHKWTIEEARAAGSKSSGRTKKGNQ